MTIEMLVRIIGGVIIAMGAIFVIWPKTLEQAARFFAVDRRVYIIATIRIILGVLLLLASREQEGLLLAVLGVLVLAAGIIILVMKLEKLQRLLLWWSARPEWMNRLAGVALAVFGVLVIVGTL